jgi:hypothetical protein
MERIAKAGGDQLREVEQFAKRIVKMAQAATFQNRMAEEREHQQATRDRESAFDGLIEVTDVDVVHGKYISVIFEPEEVQEKSDTPSV